MATGGTEPQGIAVFVISLLAIVLNCVSVANKLCKRYITPKLWKYSLLYQNVAHILTGIGLLLFYVQLHIDDDVICEAVGFFLIYGIIESTLSFLNTGVILLSVQNPGKSDSISNYHRKIFLVVVIPEVVFGALLSCLPLLSDKVVDSTEEFDVECLPILDHGKTGAAYGTLLVALWWMLLVVTLVCDVIIILKLWKFNNRVDLSPNNVWQTQLISHGKTLVSIATVSHGFYIAAFALTTVTVFAEVNVLSDHKTWIVMSSVAIATLLHGILANVSDVMWSTCCCRAKNDVQEPHRKLKKLELVKIEAPGKLRMKAVWSVGKHANKRGLMKVYGVSQLKSWAQEIVMLGMMRRAQHPSLLQCLWTNSSNPYYETMTLISGEIVTSDSRIICLEQTNGGTLDDFLSRAELPLPEPCQRMIVHDIAEGLFYLHHENILHNNLTSSCIYLKGSLQSMVLRAAIGDFEDAELYGTLQQSLDDSLRDKRYFFFPDIRSFALVALEIVSKMAVKKFHNRYVNYNSDQVPLQLNLESMISDEDEEEFEEQYCYDIEEHRPRSAEHRQTRGFDGVPSDEDEEMGVVDETRHHHHYNHQPESFQHQSASTSGSLVNLMDKDRPLSPDYRGMQRHEVGDAEMGMGSSERPYCLEMSGDEDEEMKKYSARSDSKTTSAPSPHSTSSLPIPRCKSPEVSRPIKTKSSSRKSRRDTSKSADRAFSPTRAKAPVSRSLSPKSFEQRCASPDPMQDEKLLELRKETKTGKQRKKERRFSFNRKRSEEKLNSGKKSEQPFEAFVSSGDEKSGKKKDGTWLSKPTSILKNIAGNESTVSVFKAKSSDDDNLGLDAIEEEDIDSRQRAAGKSRVKVKNKTEQKNINEVWDIIDEQYYTQCNKKAMGKLKKTVSGESRSSLWSFISTPEDMDDEDLDDILDSLPGMTDNFEFRNGKVTVNDILAERDNANKVTEERKRFSYKDLSNSRFELIDYYELLRTRQIAIEDVPEEKREMLLNVVELKIEDKLRREGKFPYKMASISEDGAIRSDEMYDNGMNPGAGNKIKMVSFRQNQCHSSPHRAPPEPEKDPRLDRVRSAPLKRTRTPVQKKGEMAENRNNPSPAFSDVKPSSAGVAKRSRARSALKRALTGKGPNANFINDRDRTPTGEKQDLTLKYATVKKVNVESASTASTETDSTMTSEVITVPVPTSESFSVKIKHTPKFLDSRLKRYPSFSSNESGSSLASSVRAPRPADVSLTSGEMSSLSSQAESDHYETDGHMTDYEGPTKTSTLLRKLKKGQGPPSRVDSGIDSGSMSSEMSEALFNRGKQSKSNDPNAPKGAVNSWARNYKTKDSLSNSPYNFGNKFLPPVYSLPEESTSVDGSARTSYAPKVVEGYGYSSSDRDTDSAISMTSSNVSSNRMIQVSESKNKGTLNLLNRPMSPEARTPQDKTVSSTSSKVSHHNRPMSPLSNPVRPSDRPMSPMGRPVSARARPMSPPSRPSSVQLKSNNRPMSPNNRPMSPNNRPMSPNSRPMSPEQTFNRPMSPPSRVMSPSTTSTRKTHTPKPDVSPSRAMSPIEMTNKGSPSKPRKPAKQTMKTDVGNGILPAPIINVEPSDGNTEGQQEKSNQASRRYRELVKQGVPLRASVIEASPTRNGEHGDFEHGGETDRPGTADSTLGDRVDDQQLFQDLESKGFFASRSNSPNRRGTSPNRHSSPQGRYDTNNNKSGTQKRKKNKKMPLEEIVREKPSGQPKAHRSRSNNHLIVSEDAFLNQPTSEDSETCSIKTNKSTNSSPSHSKPKLVVDAELVIDRIFSQNNPQDHELDVEVEAALGLDKNPLKQVKKLYKDSDKHNHEVPNLDKIPMLNGISQKHIHECLELASSLHVVTVRDLLPATKQGYETLRNKLEQVGQLGSVGVQLLDIIEKCWLLDMPPTSGSLVEQLTDPVTETEL